MEAVTIGVFGAGGHGQDIAEDIRRRWACIELYDDDPTQLLPSLAEATDLEYIIGVNDPWARAEISRRLFDETARPMRGGRWIHQSAIYSGSVGLGEHTHINAGCTLTRCTLGQFVTVAPGVDICGDVTIGDRVLIGAGATICNLVTIGSDVTIGAGTVVLPNSEIPDGSTWVGNPARRIK